MKSSSKTKTKDSPSQKTGLRRNSKRTQTAEGWRRSVEKICEKRREKKGE